MTDNINTLKKCVQNETPSSVCIQKIKNFPLSALAPNNRPLRELILVKSVDGPYKKAEMTGIIVAYNANETNSKVKIYLNKGYTGARRGPIRITKMQKLANKQNVQWKILDQTWQVIGNDENTEFQIVKKEETDQAAQKLKAALEDDANKKQITTPIQPRDDVGPVVTKVTEEKIYTASDTPDSLAKIVVEEEEIEAEIISTLFTAEIIEKFKDAIKNSTTRQNRQSETVDMVIANFFRGDPIEEKDDLDREEKDLDREEKDLEDKQEDLEDKQEDLEDKQEDLEDKQEDLEDEEEDLEDKEENLEDKEENLEDKEENLEKKEEDLEKEPLEQKEELQKISMEAKEEQLALQIPSSVV
jgi:hypothetical protein